MGGIAAKTGKLLLVAWAYSVNPRLWLTLLVGGLVVWGVARGRDERRDDLDVETLAASAERLAQEIRLFMTTTSDSCAEFEMRFGPDSRELLTRIGERVPDADVRPAWPVTDEEVVAVADRLDAASALARGQVGAR